MDLMKVNSFLFGKTQMFYPSVMAHSLSGMLIFATLIYVFLCSSKLRTISGYQTLVLLLLFAIFVAVHGISHAILEKEYGFNPMNIWNI